MKKEKVKTFLATLFVTRDVADESVSFNDAFMRDTHEAYPIYDAVSDVMHKSNLSFNFSYAIASKAVDVLEQVEDWEDNDDIQEAINSAVPVYTWELMQICQSDSWAVDEAIREYGKQETLERDVTTAWFMLIETMVEEIKTCLEAIITE